MYVNQKINKSLENELILGILVNLIFTILEFIVGITCGSLVLISDASHNIADVMSLGISFLAHKISQKKPDFQKTYGYGRVTILAAFVNTVVLILLSIYLFSQAYTRFYNPERIEGSIVILMGFLGICINGCVALLLFKYKKDLNIHSALINVFFDALASAGALIAGLIILMTNYDYIDTFISIIIALMLLISAFNIIKDVMNVLLEGVPNGIDLKVVQEEIKNVPEVIDINDLHIWSISSYYFALSCHIVIDIKNNNRSVEIINCVKNILFEKFKIKHSTIEINFARCDNSICVLVKDETI